MLAARRNQAGHGFNRRHTCKFAGLLASAAARRKQTAVQMLHLFHAGALVQVIDVLRDDIDAHFMASQAAQSAGQLPQRQVARMRCCPQHQTAPPLVPGPDARRVGFPSFGRCQFLGAKLRPQAVHGIAKSGNATFCGHARTAENDHATGQAQGIKQRSGYFGNTLGGQAEVGHVKIFRKGKVPSSTLKRQNESQQGCRNSSSPAFRSASHGVFYFTLTKAEPEGLPDACNQVTTRGGFA